MSPLRFSPRDRRAVKLGIAVMVPAVLFTHGMKPYWRALSEQQSRLEHERGMLSRERGLLLARDDLGRSLEDARGRMKSQSAQLIGGTDAALAESELVAYVQSIAALSRVLLQATDGQGSPETDPGSDLMTIRLNVRGETDYEGLVLFLSRLEGSPSLIRVPSISVERTGVETSEPLSDDQAGLVTFSAVVEAHARVLDSRNERSTAPLVASAGGP